MNIHQPGYFSIKELGPETVAFYREKGYLVVHDALSAADIGQLRKETVSICRGERGNVIDQNHDTEMFPVAQSLEQLSDDEMLRHFLCIHQPHKVSPLIHQTLAFPAIRDVLSMVIGPNVKCMQSMLFIKAAGKPGQAWHQDEDYIPTRDRSLAGAWIALDDATIDNGCLWVIPGSQQPGVLWPQYPHNDPRYDCSAMSYDFPYTDADAVPVEVPAGAIVFFNGYLLHKSEPNNRATGFRRALVNHYMSASSLLPWRSVPGTPLAKTDYRDIVMICGTDPYAYMGTEDVAKPHVRRSGEGGCGDGRVDLITHKKQWANTHQKLSHK
jgi:ectoine hydroxylase-related dioxygenase (phytanoyl-CoA dioxygenase family)